MTLLKTLSISGIRWQILNDYCAKTCVLVCCDHFRAVWSVTIITDTHWGPNNCAVYHCTECI